MYGMRPLPEAIRASAAARLGARNNEFRASAAKVEGSMLLSTVSWSRYELRNMLQTHNASRQSFSAALARGRPCLHAAENVQFLQHRMTVEQQRHHLEQIQREKEQREHADRVRQQSEQAQQAPISQAPISTSKGSKPLFPVITANKIKSPLTPHTSPNGGRGNSIPLTQEAHKLHAIKKVNETRKRNQKNESSVRLR